MREVVSRVWVVTDFDGAISVYTNDVYARDAMLECLNNSMFTETSRREARDDIWNAWENAHYDERYGRAFGLSGTCLWATEEPVMGREINEM